MWEERRGVTTYRGELGFESWIRLTRFLNALTTNERVTRIIGGWRPDGELTFDMLKEIDPGVAAKQ